jgi:hypothetical protein
MLLYTIYISKFKFYNITKTKKQDSIEQYKDNYNKK